VTYCSCPQSGIRGFRNARDRGGASLGAAGAKPHFIFGDKKKGESGFSKSSSYIAFIIYSKKEGSSIDKSVFGNPLLKYT
jgi:hypothetical protein